MPANFAASYTPIAAAGTQGQIRHVARLLATQLTSSSSTGPSKPAEAAKTVPPRKPNKVDMSLFIVSPAFSYDDATPRGSRHLRSSLRGRQQAAFSLAGHFLTPLRLHALEHRFFP